MSYIEEQTKLSACLKRLLSSPLSEILADQEFQYFNKWRNRFSDRHVHKLIQLPPYNPATPKFKDELGRTWYEVIDSAQLHSDKWNWNPYTILADKGQSLRKSERNKKYRSHRKFIREADLPGYVGAESEMVIARNGNRVVSGDQMEIFRFASSGQMNNRPVRSGSVSGDGLNAKFDIAPRQKFGHQAIMCYPAPPVRIIDFIDLLESNEVDLKNMFKSYF
ncbi:MAG: hypothetical protein KA408_05490 [Flavobacteriales bacterium]|nr:hypothetical protein [Flavobacteriales bacterium]